MSGRTTIPNRDGRDWRVTILLLVPIGILLLGYIFSHFFGHNVQEIKAPATQHDVPADHPKTGFSDLPEYNSSAMREQSEVIPEKLSDAALKTEKREAVKVLRQAGEEIKAKNFNKAIAMLNAARPTLKDIPETYLLLGRALEGRQEYAAALDFYRAALNRDPYVYEAYWGYATASESLGDLESSLGAMRSYLHTEPNPDPRRLRIVQARSAIWEWESQLGRGPWGPTKGIPPGFTANEIKRDGRGVGIKMQIPGTEQPDGTMKAEIKSQDKFKLFKED